MMSSDSSLEKVQKASAYVGIISHKYGQIPDCPQRNPDRLSLTEQLLELGGRAELCRFVSSFEQSHVCDVLRGRLHCVK